MQVGPVCNCVVQRIWRFVNGRVPSCAKGSIAALFCLTTLKTQESTGAWLSRRQ